MAKRFRFRLEPVLRVRRMKEETQQRQLATQVRELVRRESRATLLQQQIVGEVEQFHGGTLVGVLDVQLIARRRYWINHLQRQLMDERHLIGQQQQVVERERQKLAEAAREVQVLEKLEEKARQRYQQQLDRAEQADADEMAVMTYARGGGLLQDEEPC
ncbi:MAG: hypothetical protein HJJLKODD_01828 [Phycisphaerae bacterium]|nr:hypothetical protein [Phycisphaerae bacterium]